MTRWWPCLGRFCTQVLALQAGDVGFRLVDIAAHHCGFSPRTVVLQPRQPAEHLFPQITQRTNQHYGLGGVVFSHLEDALTSWAALRHRMLRDSVCKTRPPSAETARHRVVKGSPAASFNLNSYVMTHVLLEILKWGASQVVGAGGLGVGIYNYRRAKREHQFALDAPKREDQRKYRAQLREVLLELQLVFKEALYTLKLGSDLTDEVPEFLELAQKRINELLVVLVLPDKIHMQMLHLAVSRVASDWNSQRYEKPGRYPETEDPIKQSRRYSAILQELRINLEKALTEIGERIQQTVDEDNR